MERMTEMNDCPNPALHAYIEAIKKAHYDDEYEIDPQIKAAAESEVKRINAILTGLWPSLQAKLAEFHPAFEAWLRDCAERVEILLKPDYWDFNFDVYSDEGAKKTHIWHSGDVDSDGLPPDVKEKIVPALSSVLRKFLQEVWVRQLIESFTEIGRCNDYGRRHDSDDWMAFVEDLPKIVVPPDGVWAYVEARCYRLEIHLVELNEIPAQEDIFGSAWQWIKDKFPADIARLAEWKNDQEWLLQIEETIMNIKDQKKDDKPIERKPVTSSNIVSVGFCPDRKCIDVEFKSGVYRYEDCDQALFDELMKAESVGKFVHANLKSKKFTKQ